MFVWGEYGVDEQGGGWQVTNRVIVVGEEGSLTTGELLAPSARPVAGITTEFSGRSWGVGQQRRMVADFVLDILLSSRSYTINHSPPIHSARLPACWLKGLQKYHFQSIAPWRV